MPLVLQIPVKTTIKQSKDTCSPAPFFKFASLWWFNLLFPKVLIKPFLIGLIWIAAKKEHLVPHPMSDDFVLILNILHSSHTGKMFWNELLCCSQEWTFLCASSHSSYIQRDFEMSWYTWKWWIVYAISWKSNLNVLLIAKCHVIPWDHSNFKYVFIL